LEEYVEKMRSNWKLRESILSNPNISVNEEVVQQVDSDRPNLSGQSIDYGEVEYEEEDFEEEISCGFSNPVQKSLSTDLKEVELAQIEEEYEEEDISEGITPLKQEKKPETKVKEDIVEKIPEERTLEDIADKKHLLKFEPEYIPSMPANIVPVKGKPAIVKDDDYPDSESPIDDLLTERYSKKVEEEIVPAKKKHKWLDSILN
jgi:hypothetical protein